MNQHQNFLRLNKSNKEKNVEMNENFDRRIINEKAKEKCNSMPEMW